MADDNIRQRGMAYADYLSGLSREERERMNELARKRARKNTRHSTKNSKRASAGFAAMR